jgi:hypothetical protein
VIKRLALCLGLVLWSLAASAAPARVQFINGSTASGTGAMTLPGAPTAGNLILAEIGINGSGTVDTTKWTLIRKIGSGQGQVFAVFRYVVGGDTATLPPIFTTAATFASYWAVEVSGVAGNIAHDLEQVDSKQMNLATPLVTNALTTQAVNDLVFTGVFDYNANGTNITGAAGWTFDVQANNFANYGAWALTERTFASSGTNISASYTIPNTGYPSGFISLVISGTGAGGSVEYSSKLNGYPVLNVGTAASESSSKANLYPDLRYGTAAQQSSSKANMYVILQIPSGGLLNTFPP